MSKAATWTTRDGVVLRIRDMTDGHLRNTCRMLLRLAPRILDAEIDAAAWALSFVRGDMAIFDIECNIRQLQDTDPEDFVRSQHAALFREAARRRVLS